MADIGPLRESPAFRRLWAGSLLSFVGAAMTGFAVSLQVYDITRSPVAVGGLGVAQMIPTIGIGLLGGSLADAVDRRKLVLVVSICSAAASAALAAQAFAGLRLVWLLYALVAVQFSFSAISAPARRTFIPGLLAPGQLTAGLALDRLSSQIMLTVGPALAGAADTFTVVFRGTIVQAVTPDALRGRVTAADYVVGAGGGQIGNLEAGALGSLTSPAVSALSGGLVTLAGVVVIGLALPAFARYHAQADEPREASQPTPAPA
jgi:MFS family permease